MAGAPVRRSALLSPLAAAALLLLAACGPLPRPFQPEGKDLDLKAIAERSAILVLPPAGPEGAAPEALAAAMQRALGREGLLTLAAKDEAPGWRSGPQLAGLVRLDPLPAGKEAINVTWVVADAAGALWARHDSRLELAAGSWASGEEKVLERVAAEAAPALAAALRGPRIEEALIPGFPGARIIVLPVEGEPDGGSRLAEGLRRELLARGLPLAGLPGERDLLISGRVELGRPVSSWQQVTITWRLARADGKALGEVAQANRVPVGSLRQGWEASVPVIAQGAAEGALTLLRQAAGG